MPHIFIKKTHKLRKPCKPRKLCQPCKWLGAVGVNLSGLGVPRWARCA